MNTDRAPAGTAEVDPASPPVQVSTDQEGDREREPGDGGQDGASEDSAGGHTNGGRVLKLVVTLRPTDSVGYYALLAVGSDDCDPLLRSVEVADLPSALNEVASLAAEAEVRWQTSPRYPPSVKKASGSAAGRSDPKQRAQQSQPLGTEMQTQDSERAQAGQLKLFG